nr:hypothetical protein CFP56_32930 [Quercus suber]
MDDDIIPGRPWDVPADIISPLLPLEHPADPTGAGNGISVDSQIYWLWIVIPLVVLLCLICLCIWIWVAWRRRRPHSYRRMRELEMMARP